MYEKVIIIDSKKNGPTSMIIGGVHGDETCGVKAINRLAPTLKINAGRLIIAYGNPKAIMSKTRCIDKNLNRLFRLKKFLKNDEINSYEYKRACYLKRYLRQADYLLDIHATTNPKGKRFIICENNAKNISKYLPFDLVVTGFDNVQPGGTDSYVNELGKIGICVECGCKKDPKSDLLAQKAIVAFLKATKNISGNIKPRNQNIIRIYMLYKSKSGKFTIAKKFSDFEKVKKGQIIGADGDKKVKAPSDSIILFAENTNNTSSEAFLLGK